MGFFCCIKIQPKTIDLNTMLWGIIIIIIIIIASTAMMQLNKVELKAYNGTSGSHYTVHV